MTIALSVAVVLLGTLLLLLLGSQVEMYRTIEQLREYSGLVDRPIPLDLPADRTPSRAGLPATLDTAVRGVVLLLSDRCGTCRSIAASLDGSVHPDLFLVVEPGQGADGAGELALSYRLDPERTLIDRDGKIASGLGLKLTPAAVVIEHGRMTRASSIPSIRQLELVRASVRDVGGSRQAAVAPENV
ncbi:hypothetical protein BFV98_24065 [Micromonospora sp. WMMB235]|nr:hypothetical protein BFV98_24065 [Micromonospora sp. WMMB235]